MSPNLIFKSESNTLHGPQRGWWATFFVLGVIYVQASSSCCNEHFWHDCPIRIGNNKILYNPFAVPSKWKLPSNHRKCANDMSCSSCSWEFPSCLHSFPFCGRHRQQGLKAVTFACATTLYYAWESLWMVVILPDCTRCSLLPSDPRRSYNHWVHLVLRRTAKNLFGGREILSLSQCRLENFTVEVLKTPVLLYSSTVLGPWWGQEVLSTWSCAVQQRLRLGKTAAVLK
jgi:hypothetical protein